MGQLVCKSLHVVGSQPSGVVDDVVMRRRNSSLTNGLADQEEVVPLPPSDLRVNHGPRTGVL